MGSIQTDGNRAANVYPSGSTMGAATPTAPTVRRVSTETKPAYKTTEFLMWVVAVAGVLIAAALSGTDTHKASGVAVHTDYFRADKAWLYITILTAAYMLARGLAKSGSRQFHDDDDYSRGR
jgi:hypothetical protein